MHIADYLVRGGGGKRRGGNKQTFASGFLNAHKQEATARCANRRLPVDFKALIRRLTVGGHARQQ
jgi:hypothetical protein